MTAQFSMGLMYLVTIGALVVIIVLIQSIFSLRRIKGTYTLMIKHATAKVEAANAERDRQAEIADLFAGIMINLANTDNIWTIRWKLSHIRVVEDIISHLPSGICYDDNAYQWLNKMLTEEPPKSLESILESIHIWTAGYYVMDMVPGKNFVEALKEIMSKEESRREIIEKPERIFQHLKRVVAEEDLHYPIQDEEEEKKPKHSDSESSGKTLMELLAELDAEYGGKDESDVDTADNTAEPDQGQDNGRAESVKESVQLQGEEDKSISPTAETDSAEDLTLPVPRFTAEHTAGVVILPNNRTHNKSPVQQ